MHLIVSIACSYGMIIRRCENNLQMDMTVFSVSSMVPGYHIYKNLWATSISVELSYQSETESYTNPFAVVVMKDDNRVKKCCNIAGNFHGN